MATIEKRRARARVPIASPVPGTPEAPQRRQYVHLGTKGQFVVPVSLRRELGIQPGQKLRIEAAGGKLVVTPIPVDLIERLHGCLADSGDLLGDLMRDHREEIERDEAYIAGLGDGHHGAPARSKPPVKRHQTLADGPE